jgi:hypothetical protein
MIRRDPVGLRRARKLCGLLIVVACLSGADAAAQPPAQPTPPPVLAKGETVPSFEAEGLDGVKQTIAFPDGGNTVLLFFTSSCPACHKMIPEWNRQFERRPAGLRVIGVILDREPPDFFMAMPISFPVVRAPGRDFMRAEYKVYRVPLTLRVGPGCRVDGVGLGQVDGIRLGELFRP